MNHHTTFFHQRLFFLLLVLLPTQLGLHFWPEWAHILGRRVDYLSPTLYVTDILIFLTLLFWFIENIWGKGKRCPRIQTMIRNAKYILPLLFFITLNIWFASSPPVALYKWLKVLECVGFGWYIVKPRPKLSHITVPISLGVFYTSIIAISQSILQHSIGGPFWFLGERTFSIDTPGIARIDLCQQTAFFCKLLLRPYGTFSHPNVLGGYVAVLLPAIIQLSNNPINKLSNIKKYFYTVTTILGAIALVLTFSRSAWVAGILGISMTYWVLWKMQYKSASRLFSFMRHTFFATFLGTCIVLIVIFFPSSTDESVVRRNELNTVAISMWRQSPVLGVGLGNYLVELPKKNAARPGNFLQPVHNIYLLLLSEVGLAGIGLIMLTIIFFLKQGSGVRNHDQKRSNSVFPIQYSLFSILLIGCIDHYPLTLQQGQLLFTLVIGLSMSGSFRIKNLASSVTMSACSSICFPEGLCEESLQETR